MKTREVTLQGQVTAVRIPQGTPVVLRAGQALQVTQALGSSVTLRDGEGLYRLDGEQLEALGPEWAEFAWAEQKGGPVAYSEEALWEALKECYDPEIPVNIVDLGLIYDLRSTQGPDGQWQVAVKMTLTAPGCGMGPTIANDARTRLEALPFVGSAEVQIVWDPQWTPHMISEQGRQILGLD